MKYIERKSCIPADLVDHDTAIVPIATILTFSHAPRPAAYFSDSAKRIHLHVSIVGTGKQSF